MFQSDAEKIRVAVQEAVRAVAVALFWVYLAVVLGATAALAVPPGSDGWAGAIADVVRHHAHHHRHFALLVSALSREQVRGLLLDALAGAWVVAAVLGLVLVLNWRRVFGLPERWGS
jgi:hypothetical protein